MVDHNNTGIQNLGALILEFLGNSMETHAVYTRRWDGTITGLSVTGYAHAYGPEYPTIGGTPMVACSVSLAEIPDSKDDLRLKAWVNPAVTSDDVQTSLRQLERLLTMK